MKQFSSVAVLLLVLITSLASCEMIGDIFQAGITVGIVLVVVVVLLIVWLVSRFRR